MPWVLCAIRVLMGGSATPDLVGIFAGHVYYFLVDVQGYAMRAPLFLSDALDQLEERTLVACMGIVLLGMGSLLGLPPMTITVLYFALVAASAVYIGLAVRAVWREEKGKIDEGGHGLDGALGKHQLSVTRVPKKRLVV